MKGIILAAGRGVRLGPHTADKPKSLIPLGGITLLQRNVENLRKAGVKEVVVVVGYRHEMIEDMLAKNFPANFYRTIMNPDYTRGSGSSLVCAQQEMQGDIIMVESDLLYDGEILKRLSAPSVKKALTMGFFNHNRKEVKLYLKNNYIQKAQWAEPEDKEADGDWVGFTRLDSEGSHALKTILEQTHPEQGKEIGYESFIFELVQKYQFQSILIQDLPWIEIDNEIDLKKAIEEVYPRIEAREKASCRSQH